MAKNLKHFDFFCFVVTKCSKKPCISEKIASSKALFIKPKKLNQVDNKRIASSDKNRTVKIDLNTSLLDIDLNVMLSHLRYAENAYAKYFDKNSKGMNHLVKDEEIIKKTFKYME